MKKPRGKENGNGSFRYAFMGACMLRAEVRQLGGGRLGDSIR